MRTMALCFLLAAVVCGAANAVEFRTGDRIVIGPDEVIDDDLFVAGQAVSVEGTVTGDLFAAANTVRVSGRVEGSEMLAGQSVEVTGDAAGSVRAAGRHVNVGAKIGRNLAAAGQIVEVDAKASVGRDLHAAGNLVELDGAVGRNAALAAQTAVVAARIAGSLYGEGNSLTVEDGAAVGGDLKTRTEHDPVISPQATVAGETLQLPPRAGQPKRRSPYLPAFLLFLVVLISGFIGMAALPRIFKHAAGAVGQRFWWNLLVGVIVLIVVPGAAFIVCVTLVGLPTGLFALTCWGLAMLLAGVPVGTFLGNALLRRLGAARGVSPYWALLVGLAILTLVGLVPFLGAITKLATVLLGMGVFARAAKGLLAEARRPAVAS